MPPADAADQPDPFKRHEVKESNIRNRALEYLRQRPVAIDAAQGGKVRVGYGRE
jgi:hypothetical protein